MATENTRGATAAAPLNTPPAASRESQFDLLSFSRHLPDTWEGGGGGEGAPLAAGHAGRRCEDADMAGSARSDSPMVGSSGIADSGNASPCLPSILPLTRGCNAAAALHPAKGRPTLRSPALLDAGDVGGNNTAMTLTLAGTGSCTWQEELHSAAHRSGGGGVVVVGSVNVPREVLQWGLPALGEGGGAARYSDEEQGSGTVSSDSRWRLSEPSHQGRGVFSHLVERAALFRSAVAGGLPRLGQNGGGDEL